MLLKVTLCFGTKTKIVHSQYKWGKKASSAEFSKVFLPSGFEAKLTIYEESWQNIKIRNNTAAKTVNSLPCVK